MLRGAKIPTIFCIIALIAVTVCSGCNSAAISSPSSVYPIDLQCEYLTDPLGIDVLQPRLSWKMHTSSQQANGLRQSAYQILVSSTLRKLQNNQGDLWDSGLVNSDKSVLVPYHGRPLSSNQICYWKVRIKDQAGHMSSWSEPSRWSMGLLHESDWLAQWIGSDIVLPQQEGSSPPDNIIPDPWFRKTVMLQDRPRQAFIHIASIGYYELYINGRKISPDILVPSVTDNRKRARYRTYDIADYLRRGKNVIAMWLGVSWSIYPEYKTPDKPQTPMVIAQAELTFADGRRQQIVTDNSWKTHPSPNILLGIWRYGNYGGEQYDANKQIQNWAGLSLDDSGWKAAVVYHPAVVLSADMIEPNRKIKIVSPVAIEEVSPGVYRVDMGVNFAGWLECDLSGNTGDVIVFKFSERPDKDITYHLQSKYIVGPTGKGTFRNHFNYFSGRWIQIEGLQYKPFPGDIRAWMVHTNYRRAGRFECSNDLLNKIYNTTLWTFENLSLGGYMVDCPQRERMGYGGDAHATIGTGLSNYQLGAFYTKWSQDWRDVQKDDGDLPFTAPTYWGGGGPAWSGFCITLPWRIYLRYGDTRILEQNFSTIRHWLAFLDTRAKDNILQRYGKGKWEFLGDWLWPGAKGVNGDTIETLFFNNCYWIYNLQTAARIAKILGHDDLARKYTSRAETVRRAVQKKFFKPEQNSYVNGFQGYLAMALFVNLPPLELRPAVWKSLEDEILIHRKGHIHAGITAGAFLMRTLLKYDRQDLIFPMANQVDYPGWGYMLNKGATTIWESWEGQISLLHSSYLYIGQWFIEGLGGIKPDPLSPGFQHFIIKPPLLNEPSLTWVKASYESPYGNIISRWEKTNGRFCLDTAVPANASARIFIPAKNANSITLNGHKLLPNKDVHLVKQAGDYTVLEVSAGYYQFISKM